MNSFFKKGIVITMLLFVFTVLLAPVAVGLTDVDSSGHIVLTTNIAHADSPTPPDGAQGITPSNALDCKSADWWEFGTQLKCAFRWVIAAILAIPVYVFVTLLKLVGQLFDYVMYATVISFSTFYQGGIQSAVETAWTAFRDIANILIIGVFAFIAIAIILGLDQYGKKKFVANLLIIAVLINFSLLFTKMAFDASNFTATQFYVGIQKLGVANCGSTVVSSITGNTNTTTATGQTSNVACAFLKFSGVVTASGDTAVLDKLKASYDAEGGDFGTMFMHAFMITFLCISLMIVLLYGCWLLIARAVLIVFLLVTSSLAFAAFALPVLGDSWWNKWVDGVKHNAILAPLLMLFLWVSALVAVRLGDSSGALSALESGSPGPSGYAAFFHYLIVLGLLYVSFYAASTFTKQMTGSSVLGMNSAAGLAKGSAQWFGGKAGAMTGAAGMFTAGKIGSAMARQFESSRQKWQENAVTSKSAAGRIGSQFLANRLNELSKGSKKLTQFSYNPAQTGAGKALNLGQGQKGGLEGFRKRAAEEAAKEGERLGIKKVNEAQDVVRKANANYDDRVAAGAAASEHAKTQESIGKLTSAVTELTNQKTFLQNQHTDALAAADHTRAAELQLQIDKVDTQLTSKQNALTGESAKISKAKVNAQVKAVLRSHEAYKDHQDRINRYYGGNVDNYLKDITETEFNSLMQRMGEDAVSLNNQVEELMPEKMAARMADQRGAKLAGGVGKAVVATATRVGTLGLVRPEYSMGGTVSKEIAEAARKQVKGNAESKAFKKLAEQLKTTMDSDKPAGTP